MIYLKVVPKKGNDENVEKLLPANIEQSPPKNSATKQSTRIKTTRSTGVSTNDLNHTPLLVKPTTLDVKKDLNLNTSSVQNPPSLVVENSSTSVAEKENISLNLPTSAVLGPSLSVVKTSLSSVVDEGNLNSIEKADVDVNSSLESSIVPAVKNLTPKAVEKENDPITVSKSDSTCVLTKSSKKKKKKKNKGNNKETSNEESPSQSNLELKNVLSDEDIRHVNQIANELKQLTGQQILLASVSDFCFPRSFFSNLFMFAKSVIHQRSKYCKYLTDLFHVIIKVKL